MLESPEDKNTSAPIAWSARSRVQFVDFNDERSNDGKCVISVVLQHPSGEQIIVEDKCDASGESSLRCAATAMIKALDRAIGSRAAFELLGIKAVKAFDTSVIIVAISAKQHDNVQRLVGSCLVGDSPEYGAAVAVLNATNRFMGSIFQS